MRTISITCNWIIFLILTNLIASKVSFANDDPFSGRGTEDLFIDHFTYESRRSKIDNLTILRYTNSYLLLRNKYPNMHSNEASHRSLNEALHYRRELGTLRRCFNDGTCPNKFGSETTKLLEGISRLGNLSSALSLFNAAVTITDTAFSVGGLKDELLSVPYLDLALDIKQGNYPASKIGQIVYKLGKKDPYFATIYNTLIVGMENRAELGLKVSDYQNIPDFSEHSLALKLRNQHNQILNQLNSTTTDISDKLRLIMEGVGFGNHLNLGNRDSLELIIKNMKTAEKERALILFQQGRFDESLELIMSSLKDESLKQKLFREKQSKGLSGAIKLLKGNSAMLKEILAYQRYKIEAEDREKRERQKHEEIMGYFKETESSIYILSFALSKINPQLAQDFSAFTGAALTIAKSSYSYFSAESIGTATLTANYLSAAIQIYSIFNKKRQTPPEKIILDRIVELSKQIYSLGRSLHQRFDFIDARLSQINNNLMIHFKEIELGLDHLYSQNERIMYDLKLLYTRQFMIEQDFKELITRLNAHDFSNCYYDLLYKRTSDYNRREIDNCERAIYLFGTQGNLNSNPYQTGVTKYEIISNLKNTDISLSADRIKALDNLEYISELIELKYGINHNLDNHIPAASSWARVAHSYSQIIDSDPLFFTDRKNEYVSKLKILKEMGQAIQKFAGFVNSDYKNALLPVFNNYRTKLNHVRSALAQYRTTYSEVLLTDLFKSKDLASPATVTPTYISEENEVAIAHCSDLPLLEDKKTPEKLNGLIFKTTADVRKLIPSHFNTAEAQGLGINEFCWKIDQVYTYWAGNLGNISTISDPNAGVFILRIFGKFKPNAQYMRKLGEFRRQDDFGKLVKETVINSKSELRIYGKDSSPQEILSSSFIYIDKLVATPIINNIDPLFFYLNNNQDWNGSQEDVEEAFKSDQMSKLLLRKDGEDLSFEIKQGMGAKLFQLKLFSNKFPINELLERVRIENIKTYNSSVISLISLCQENKLPPTSTSSRSRVREENELSHKLCDAILDLEIDRLVLKNLIVTSFDKTLVQNDSIRSFINGNNGIASSEGIKNLISTHGIDIDSTIRLKNTGFLSNDGNWITVSNDKDVFEQNTELFEKEMQEEIKENSQNQTLYIDPVFEIIDDLIIKGESGGNS